MPKPIRVCAFVKTLHASHLNSLSLSLLPLPSSSSFFLLTTSIRPNLKARAVRRLEDVTGGRVV